MKFDSDQVGSETIQILKSKHEDGNMLKDIQDTPSNNVHLKFLDALRIVEGVTNHGLLFSEQEEINEQDDMDLNEKIQ